MRLRKKKGHKKAPNPFCKRFLNIVLNILLSLDIEHVTVMCGLKLGKQEEC